MIGIINQAAMYNNNQAVVCQFISAKTANRMLHTGLSKKPRPLHLTAVLFKTLEPVCMIFGTVQQRLF